MFYKTGVDITNDKQMFNFLKNHFEYFTLSSWNRLSSIANNVKLYRLDLTGSWTTTLRMLEGGEYETLSYMIQEWQEVHPGYEVYFNGRSSGYLVLKETGSNCSVLPSSVLDCDTYDDYKNYCKSYIGSVKENRSELIAATKLVQDFDKLCDELRNYCNELSMLKFEVVAMEKAIQLFNDRYEEDLELLGFKPLSCDRDGKVDVSEITTLLSLFEAFWRTANQSDLGYVLKSDGSGFMYYEEK